MLAGIFRPPTAKSATGHHPRQGTARRPVKNWARDEEPPLAELLNDPLTRRLMASDGVKPEMLAGLVAEARARLLTDDAPAP